MIDVLCDPTIPTKEDINISCPTCAPADAVGYRIGGNYVLWHDGIIQNIYVGVGAGNATSTAINNTFWGNNVGHVNGTGFDNTFGGAMAGATNNTGDSNTFIGYFAGKANTIATSNSFLGCQAAVPRPPAGPSPDRPQPSVTTPCASPPISWNHGPAPSWAPTPTMSPGPRRPEPTPPPSTGSRLDRRPGRVDGGGPAPGRRPARPGRRGGRRLGPPNGLRVERVRVPLGVVGIIYENRPNVTSDAAGLCLKSGNAVFLRGSSRAISIQPGRRRRAARRTGQGRAAGGRGRPGGGHQPGPADRVHAARRASSTASSPGAAPSLIASILEHATVPYVIDGDGNCHVYVDARRRPGHGRAHRGQRQDPAAQRVQRRRVAGRAPRRWPMCSCPGSPPPSTGSSCSATTPTRAIAARDRVAATEEDFAAEFLGLDPVAWPSSTTSTPPSTTSPATGRATPRPSSPRDLGAAGPVHHRGRRRRRGGQRLDPLRRRRASSASGPRSASPPRSCTPAARWGCASSRRSNTSSQEQARCVHEQ